MDDKLSWKSQVAYVVSKAGKRIGLLGRIRKQLTTYSASKIYTSFIRQIFDYCHCAWAGCNRTDNNTLERLQRRAARVTRQSNLLHLPRVRLETTKKSFFYNGCVVFNSFK